MRFDPLAEAVDWLDHCRARDLPAVLAHYAENAIVDCACTKQKLCAGKPALTLYWRERLADLSPALFQLEDIWPEGDEAVVEYLSHSGKRVRAVFKFDDDGLISHTRCGPAI